MSSLAKLDRAKAWLLQTLANGRIPVSKVRELAKNQGLPWRTVELARSQLKPTIATTRRGMVQTRALAKN